MVLLKISLGNFILVYSKSWVVLVFRFNFIFEKEKKKKSARDILADLYSFVKRVFRVVSRVACCVFSVLTVA
jgi:hypothetical protein